MILTTTVTAIASAIVLASDAARAPQWQKSPEICRQLRAEGWKAAPDGAGDPATGEMRHLKIFVCHLREILPARAGTKPAHIDVFMQHGGGDSLAVSASFWAVADQEATLEAAANTLRRLARELELTLPVDLLERVSKGDRSSDEVGDLRFHMSRTTREEELITQPDLKASDVPLVTFTVSVEPKDN